MKITLALVCTVLAFSIIAGLGQAWDQEWLTYPGTTWGTESPVDFTIPQLTEQPIDYVGLPQLSTGEPTDYMWSDIPTLASASQPVSCQIASSAGSNYQPATPSTSGSAYHNYPYSLYGGYYPGYAYYSSGYPYSAYSYYPAYSAYYYPNYYPYYSYYCSYPYYSSPYCANRDTVSISYATRGPGLYASVSYYSDESSDPPAVSSDSGNDVTVYATQATATQVATATVQSAQSDPGPPSPKLRWYEY